jgi:predicted MFS family arabinose efflux permease
LENAFGSGAIIPDQSFRTETRIAFAFVTVMAAATVLSFVHRFLPVVLLDDLRRDIQISDLEFSSLQTSFAITYAVTTITSGWMADRSNRRNLLVVGVAAWTLGSFVFGLATSLSGLFAGRILVGAGEAVLVPAGTSLMCSYVSAERRGKAFAITYFGATLGTSLAFSGGGFLLEAARDASFSGLPLVGALGPWRQVMLLLGSAGMLLIPALLAFREPSRTRTSGPIGFAGFIQLWQLRSLLWIALLMGASIAIADFAYTSWQTALLTREHGMGVAAAGNSLGITILVAGSIGAWVGGIATDRALRLRGKRGRPEIIVACALLMGLAPLTIQLPFAWAAIVAFALWQLAANVAYVANAVTLQDIVDDQTRGLATALQVCLGIGVGLGAGPAAIAVLNTQLGGDALGTSLSLGICALAIGTAALGLALGSKLPMVAKSS